LRTVFSASSGSRFAHPKAKSSAQKTPRSTEKTCV
jgi:hypothetical protein